ncbi:hypothetical protein NOR_07147 [Metarhizium rileyi]|uniref:Uncharacterized protein n=1 Tax=Metarhizium rileyi (strain RCEF 4871) TaxID=1649241 RepID=A0A166Z1J3_METRR|nr:hypothetical protein NOR_07147 [Metarhizium rileyi RCEF 4871]
MPGIEAWESSAWRVSPNIEAEDWGYHGHIGMRLVAARTGGLEAGQLVRI